MNKQALTIESVQQIQHKMLGELMAQLTVKNVPVYLLGGTLLGAVREGHQLGWDDDMDLGLLRQDYDQFIDDFVSSDNQIRLMTEFDSDSWVPYARLVYVPSKAESEYYNMNHGVFIDIFPIDAIDTAKLSSRLIFATQKGLNIMRNMACSTGVLPDDAKLKHIKRLLWPVIKHTNAHTWALAQANLAKRVSNVNGTQLGVINGVHGKREFFVRENWEMWQIAQFENTKVAIIGNVDQYLTQIFGDWRTPVKQLGQHATFFESSGEKENG